MSPPKHLWSGDWERESTEPPPESARVTTPPPAPESSGPPPSATSASAARGRPTRQSVIVGGAVIVLVIVGIALAFSLGGSKKTQTQQQASAQPFGTQGSGGASIYPTQTTPQVAPVQTQTTAAPVNVGPTYSWLGTEIIDSSSGVTVETIQIGSAADTAGVNPGDVIQAVNNTQVSSVAQLRQATAGLKLGQTFQLTVDRGTTQVTIAATLTNRPVKQS